MMNVIQYHEGGLAVCVPFVNQVRSKIPNGVGYTFIDEYRSVVANCDDYRAKSNIVRCVLGSVKPDMLWIDTDAVILKWPDFEFTEGKVYFYSGIYGKPENCVFYVNGRTDFFSSMHSWFLNTLPEGIGWFAKYVRDHQNEVELFPSGYFDHAMLSRAYGAGRYFHSLHAKSYSINRNAENGQLISEVHV